MLTELGDEVPPAMPVTVTLVIFSVVVWFESVPPAEAVIDTTVSAPRVKSPTANGQESLVIALASTW